MTGDIGRFGRVSPEFIAAAAAADCVIDVAGHRCVAGAYRDPLTGQHQCLIEFAAPELLGADGGPAALLRAATAACPGATSVLLRLHGEDPVPVGWQPAISYLRYAVRPSRGSAAEAVGVGRIEVAEAAEADNELVGAWLGQAMRHACRERGLDADPAAVAAQVRELLAQPDRITFVARLGSALIGHATLLRDAYDAPSGTEMVELWDILVASAAHRRTTTAALVAAAAWCADGLGRPLVGDVVHPAVGGGMVDGGPVLPSLLAKGWRLTHRYVWTAVTATNEVKR